MKKVHKTVINPCSNAERAQKKHWETKGQLIRCYRLLGYILDHNQSLPDMVGVSIRGAQQCLAMAIRRESANNEFLNLNIQPSWMPAKGRKVK